MTKAQLVDLFLDRLAGGDAPDEIRGKFHPLVIAKYIDVAYANFLEQTSLRARQTMDFLNLDYYRKTFTSVDVLNDSDRDEKYSQLPVPIVQLSGQESIVVHPKNDPSSQFLPHSAGGADAVFAALEVSYHNQLPSYRLEGDKVYFPDLIDASCVKVTMRLIPIFSAFEDTDEIYLPTGGEVRMFDILVQTMVQKKAIPEDTNNDNNAE